MEGCALPPLTIRGGMERGLYLSKRGGMVGGVTLSLTIYSQWGMTPPFHDRGGREKGRKRGGRGLFCAKKGKTTRQPLVQRGKNHQAAPRVQRGESGRGDCKRNI